MREFEIMTWKPEFLKARLLHHGLTVVEEGLGKKTKLNVNKIMNWMPNNQGKKDVCIRKKCL